MAPVSEYVDEYYVDKVAQYIYEHRLLNVPKIPESKVRCDTNTNSLHAILKPGVNVPTDSAS